MLSGLERPDPPTAAEHRALYNMPTYTYRREDGTRFDIEQRITDDRLTACPTTGQPVERLISGGGGLVFKGSGFYQTDYVRKGNGSDESSRPPSGNASDKETKKETKKDINSDTSTSSGSAESKD